MISLVDARARVLERMGVATPVRMPLQEALGRILAEPMHSSRDLPGLDNSAMDGFALRAEETRGSTRDAPSRFTLVETLYAGHAPRRAIGPGEAARIFTGAPIPPGATTVVRQEAAASAGDRVEVFVEADAGANIRRRGEEIASGAPLFSVGQRLDAYALGVLASIGVAEVAVFPPPRVALITIGDELVQPGRPAAAQQIYDSNAVVLRALLTGLGVSSIAATQVRDDDGAIHSVLQRAAATADLLITSGGASVGDRDRIKKVLLADGGELFFDGVAMKPGKPAALGALERRPVLILPGNPGAATVAFDQLVRPAILKLQGVLEERETIEVRLAAGQRKQAGLTYLLAARRRAAEDGTVWADVRPQGAGQLLQNVGASGWVVLPPGRGEFFAGDPVPMQLFDGASLRPA